MEPGLVQAVPVAGLCSSPWRGRTVLPCCSRSPGQWDTGGCGRLWLNQGPGSESQHGRGWQGPLGIPQSHPLPKQGHPEQAAQHRVQPGLEYLQRRRLPSPSGQPVPPWLSPAPLCSRRGCPAGRCPDPHPDSRPRGSSAVCCPARGTGLRAGVQGGKRCRRGD